MLLQRVGGTDSDIVVETKPHRPIAFRMMTWWPHAAKGGVHLTADHKIDGGYDGARRALRGCQRSRADHGIRIKPGIVRAQASMT